MDNDMMKTVRRLVFVNTLFGFGSSFVNSMNELGDDIDEVFETASVKRQQLRGVFTDGQNNKEREI